MKVTVLGAGNAGIAMAAQVAMGGDEVTLWNRTPATIKKLKETKTIHTTGILEGPVQIAHVTSSIEEAIKGAEILLITTPANSYNDILKMMAPHLKTESVPILLCPGRTLGALDVSHLLSLMGDYDFVAHNLIAETQTMIYTSRKTAEDAVNILAIKEGVKLSCVNPDDNDEFMDFMPKAIAKYFDPDSTMAETSLGNMGLILHCVPMMLNTGWIESEFNFKHYHEGISRSIGNVLEKLDRERLNIAKALGYDLESCSDWLKRVYKVEGDSLYDCVHRVEAYKDIMAPTTINHRYLTEDVPSGLVPLEALGRIVGSNVSTLTISINLANSLLKRDFRALGRNIGRICPDGDTEGLINMLEKRKST